MKKDKRYTIRITGRVQGVFFRKTAADKAKDLGLKGYVENKPDGSVYMEAEGSEEKLREMLDWSYKGSPAADVDDVQHEEKEVKGYSDFEVKR